MELPDFFGLVVWVLLVLDFVFPIKFQVFFMLPCVLLEGNLTVCVAFLFLFFV